MLYLHFRQKFFRLFVWLSYCIWKSENTCTKNIIPSERVKNSIFFFIFRLHETYTHTSPFHRHTHTQSLFVYFSSEEWNQWWNRLFKALWSQWDSVRSAHLLSCILIHTYFTRRKIDFLLIFGFAAFKSESRKRVHWAQIQGWRFELNRIRTYWPSRCCFRHLFFPLIPNEYISFSLHSPHCLHWILIQFSTNLTNASDVSSEFDPSKREIINLTNQYVPL